MKLKFQSHHAGIGMLPIPIVLVLILYQYYGMVSILLIFGLICPTLVIKLLKELNVEW